LPNPTQKPTPAATRLAMTEVQNTASSSSSRQTISSTSSTAPRVSKRPCRAHRSMPQIGSSSSSRQQYQGSNSAPSESIEAARQRLDALLAHFDRCNASPSTTVPKPTPKKGASRSEPRNTKPLQDQSNKPHSRAQQTDGVHDPYGMDIDITSPMPKDRTTVPNRQDATSLPMRRHAGTPSTESIKSAPPDYPVRQSKQYSAEAQHQPVKGFIQDRPLGEKVPTKIARLPSLPSPMKPPTSQSAPRIGLRNTHAQPIRTPHQAHSVTNTSHIPEPKKGFKSPFLQPRSSPRRETPAATTTDRKTVNCTTRPDIPTNRSLPKKTAKTPVKGARSSSKSTRSSSPRLAKLRNGSTDVSSDGPQPEDDSFDSFDGLFVDGGPEVDELFKTIDGSQER
jgi:hypothetical protein